MKRVAALLTLATMLQPVCVIGQIATGDRSTPLRPLAGEGNVGVSNATLLDQEARILRVLVEAGATRVMHQHDDVQYHLFIPITGPMELRLADGKSVEVKPWQPYLMKRGTLHGFHNNGSSAVEILEVFVK